MRNIGTGLCVRARCLRWSIYTFSGILVLPHCLCPSPACSLTSCSARVLIYQFTAVHAQLASISDERDANGIFRRSNVWLCPEFKQIRKKGPLGRIKTGHEGTFWISCSVAKLSATLCDPTEISMPDFPVLRYLPEHPTTHVH